MWTFYPAYASSLVFWLLGSATVVCAIGAAALARRAMRQIPDRNEDFVLTERGPR